MPAERKKEVSMNPVKNQSKGGKFSWVLLISVLVLCFSFQPLNASTGSDYPNIGLGGRFIPVLLDQKVFYPNLSADIGNFGAEFGGNSVNFQVDESYSYNSRTYSLATNASSGFYVANLKYYFRTDSLIRPHLGAGFINIGLNGEGEVTREYEGDSTYGPNSRSQGFDISAKIGGYNFTFGLDLPLKHWDIPLVLVAGINHYSFHNLDVNASMTSSYTYDGEESTHENKIEESFTYSLSLFHYHFGLRYEF